MPAAQPATAWVNEPFALEEGDLRALGAGVAGGEAGVVGRDAGLAGEGPGRAERAVSELARTNLDGLETRVADGGAWRRDDVVDKGGVVAAGGVQAEEGRWCGPAVTVNAAVV